METKWKAEKMREGGLDCLPIRFQASSSETTTTPVFWD